MSRHVIQLLVWWREMLIRLTSKDEWCFPSCVRFQVLRPVIITIVFVWGVPPDGLVGRNQRYRNFLRMSSPTLMMETADASETVVYLSVAVRISNITILFFSRAGFKITPTPPEFRPIQFNTVASLQMLHVFLVKALAFLFSSVIPSLSILKHPEVRKCPYSYKARKKNLSGTSLEFHWNISNN
jgi:hypothetical protein